MFLSLISLWGLGDKKSLLGNLGGTAMLTFFFFCA